MAATAFVTQPPRTLAGWVACCDAAALPVLAATAAALQALRADEDRVDARLLAEAAGNDPLFTLKLLAHVARLRRNADGRGTESVTAALVLLGIGPFFRAFGPQPTVQDTLAALPAAQAGFDAVQRRARRAADFALAFAIHRMDHDAAAIRQAALLHDCAELLLWLRAPALALAIRDRQRADRTLRSAAVQRELLHMELADLQQALMAAWGLPPLLARISDDRHADHAQVRTVLLAIRVARHSARGWDDAALPDDIADIAALLQLGHEPVRALLRDIDGG